MGRGDSLTWLLLQLPRFTPSVKSKVGALNIYARIEISSGEVAPS